MATTYRPTPAFTLVYAVTTGLVVAVAVIGVNLLLDLITGTVDVTGALTIGIALGLALGGLTAGIVRRRSLTLVPDGVVVLRDRVRVALSWRDFEEVRTLGLLQRDELVFRASELAQANPDKPVPQRVLDRMRKSGADRTVVVSDFVTDWKSTELYAAVRRSGRG